MLIRPIVETDVPSLVHLDRLCFSQCVAFSAEEFSGLIWTPGRIGFVLEDSAGIHAFLIGLWGGRRAEIATIDVAPGSRRNGYATVLLAFFEAGVQEKGVDRLLLQVDVGNGPAICFYEKESFRRVRRLRRYYSDGHDAFLMSKRLQDLSGTICRRDALVWSVNLDVEGFC